MASSRELVSTRRAGARGQRPELRSSGAPPWSTVLRWRSRRSKGARQHTEVLHDGQALFSTRARSLSESFGNELARCEPEPRRLACVDATARLPHIVQGARTVLN